MAQMRLALAVGRVDVDEMLTDLTPAQWDEWEAYWKVEPFGDWWRGLAMLTAAWAGGRPADYMPPGCLDNPHHEQEDPEQQAANRYGSHGS